MAEFKLPDVGEGLTEAEIVAWKVKVGDTVEINDIIVEIETAKSLVELPSPYAGTVQALLVAEGEMIPVGTPIIAIGDPAEAPAPAAAAPAAPRRDGDRPVQPRRQRRRRGREPGRPQQGRPRSAASRPSRPGDAGDRRRHRVPDPAAGRVRARRRPVARTSSRPTRAGAGDVGPHRARPAAMAMVPAAATEPGAVRALAKPPVRKLAKDLGVDLALLRPTGPDGTVTREDVQAAAGGSGCRRRRRDGSRRSPRRRAASARPASRSRASAR